MLLKEGKLDCSELLVKSGGVLSYVASLVNYSEHFL